MPHGKLGVLHRIMHALHRAMLTLASQLLCTVHSCYKLMVFWCAVAPAVRWCGPATDSC
jgi:hypothetical protein